MPMDKKRYPKDWAQIATEVKEKAGCAPCHLRYDAKHHAETRRMKK